MLEVGLIKIYVFRFETCIQLLKQRNKDNFKNYGSFLSAIFWIILYSASVRECVRATI